LARRTKTSASNRLRDRIGLEARTSTAQTVIQSNPGASLAMELKLSHEEGYVLAELAGPIDDSAGELFREFLHPLVGQPGTKMVVEMSQALRVTSYGIGHLVALVSHANTNSSRVVLAACSSFVSIVFDRTQLDRFFDIAQDLPEAVNKVLDQ
jgi:anti-anti-sigma factor